MGEPKGPAILETWPLQGSTRVRTQPRQLPQLALPPVHPHSPCSAPAHTPNLPQGMGTWKGPSTPEIRVSQGKLHPGLAGNRSRSDRGGQNSNPTASIYIVHDLDCVPATLPRVLPHLLTCILSVPLGSCLVSPKALGRGLMVSEVHSRNSQMRTFWDSPACPVSSICHGGAGVDEL